MICTANQLTGFYMRATLAFNVLISNTEDQVNKSEVQVLLIVNKNLSFASTRDDNNQFPSMFSDSTIAKSHRMSDTKAHHLIKFGIANYF